MKEAKEKAMKRIGTACGVIALLFSPKNVAAQQVLGRVVQEIDGSPLVEALIIMVDDAEHESARAVTTPSGAFDLQAPRAGRFRIRVQRIGQRGWETPAFELAAGQIFRPTFRVPDRPFELTELSASVQRPNCSVTLGDASLGATLLQSAQTALALAEVEMTKGQRSYATETYKRTVPVVGPAEDSVVIAGNLTGWPIQSADPDSLRHTGFVSGDWPAPSLSNLRPENGPTYFGPDARVLFTDWFLRSHCISVDSQSTPSRSLIVARFTPAKGTRPAAALKGSLDFDRASLALRSLSFQFVARPRWAPPDAVGGEIRFARLPDGAWLPVSWIMRAPIPKVAADGQRYRFFGVMEAGGRVTAIRGIKGEQDRAAEEVLHASE
jgi:Carboxypeptidase regulatory-like domain